MFPGMLLNPSTSSLNLFAAHHAAADAAAGCVQRCQLSDPIIEHSGTISLHMKDVMINILTSAGFKVEESRDNLRPFMVRVISGPPGGKLWFERPR